MRSLLTLWKKGIEEHEERYHFSRNRIIIPGPSRTPSGYLIQASFSYAQARHPGIRYLFIQLVIQPSYAILCSTPKGIQCKHALDVPYVECKSTPDAIHPTPSISRITITTPRLLQMQYSTIKISSSNPLSTFWALRGHTIKIPSQTSRSHPRAQIFSPFPDLVWLATFHHHPTLLRHRVPSNSLS